MKQHAVYEQLTKIDIFSGYRTFGGYVIVQQLKKYSNITAVSQAFAVGPRSSWDIIAIVNHSKTMITYVNALTRIIGKLISQYCIIASI